MTKQTGTSIVWTLSSLPEQPFSLSPQAIKEHVESECPCSSASYDISIDGLDCVNNIYTRRSI